MTEQDPIVVRLSADTAPLKSKLAEATAEIRRSLATLQNEFRTANENIKLTPRADTAGRRVFAELRDAIEDQVNHVSIYLDRLTREFEASAAKLEEATRRMNTPLERGPGGKFLPRDTSTPEYQAALQMRQEALAAQAQVAEKMQVLERYAADNAAQPGQLQPTTNYVTSPAAKPAEAETKPTPAETTASSAPASPSEAASSPSGTLIAPVVPAPAEQTERETNNDTRIESLTDTTVVSQAEKNFSKTDTISREGPAAEAGAPVAAAPVVERPQRSAEEARLNYQAALDQLAVRASQGDRAAGASIEGFRRELEEVSGEPVPYARYKGRLLPRTNPKPEPEIPAISELAAKGEFQELSSPRAAEPVGQPGRVTHTPEPGKPAPLPPPTPARPIPAGLPEPWQVRKEDLLPLEATRPQRRAPAPVTESTDYSEEALHARSIAARASEDVPPLVQSHPLGSYAADYSGELMQLQPLRLDDPALLRPEGTPRNGTVDKYTEWIRQGHQPPPVEAIETEGGSLKLNEGHHRLAALENVGAETTPAWVSLTQNVPIGRREDTGEVITSGRGLTHEDAVRQAVAAGKPVPPEVLADYPHLAPADTAAVSASTQVDTVTPAGEARKQELAPPVIPSNGKHGAEILEDLGNRLNTGPGSVLANLTAGAGEDGTAALAQRISDLVVQHGDPRQTPQRLGGGNESSVYDIGNGNVLKVRPDRSLEAAGQAYAEQAALEGQLGEYANPAIERQIHPLADGAVGLEVQPRLTPIETDRAGQKALATGVWQQTGVAPDAFGASTNFGLDANGRTRVFDTGAAIPHATPEQAARQFAVPVESLPERKTQSAAPPPPPPPPPAAPPASAPPPEDEGPKKSDTTAVSHEKNLETEREILAVEQQEISPRERLAQILTDINAKGAEAKTAYEEEKRITDQRVQAQQRLTELETQGGRPEQVAEQRVQVQQLSEAENAAIERTTQLKKEKDDLEDQYTAKRRQVLADERAAQQEETSSIGRTTEAVRSGIEAEQEAEAGKTTARQAGSAARTAIAEQEAEGETSAAKSATQQRIAVEEQASNGFVGRMKDMASRVTAPIREAWDNTTTAIKSAVMEQQEAVTSADGKEVQSTVSKTAQIKAQLASLATQKKQAIAAEQQAYENLAEITALYGRKAAEGNQQAAAELRIYQEELDKAKAQTAALTEQTEALTLQLREMGAAGRNSGSSFITMRKAQEEMAVLSGSTNMLEYSMARLAATSKLLGPLIEAAFPVFGVVGMVEILGDVVEKLAEVERAFDQTYQAQERWLREGKEDAKEYKKALEENNKLILEQEEREHGKTFRLKTEADQANREAPVIGYAIEQRQAEIREQQKIVKAGTITTPEMQSNEAGVPATPTGRTITTYTDAAKAAQVRIQQLEEQIETQKALLANAERQANAKTAEVHASEAADLEHNAQEEIAVLRSKNRLTAEAEIAIWERVRDEAAKGGKETEGVYRTALTRIGELTREAERERVQQLRNADQAALADLQADHKLTVDEEIAFWEKRLAVERAYADRYREIHNTLGHLRQRKDAEDDRDEIKRQDQEAENMVRPDGKPDRKRQLDYWNERAAESRPTVDTTTVSAPADVDQLSIPQLITRQAQLSGVDPKIALAVAQQESQGRQFNEDGSVVRSKAGALGVMQLEPGTAQDLGVNPYDTVSNIQGGITYLKQLFDKYQDWAKALAAYNWGPGNVDKGGPMPEETQKYAPSVLAKAENVTVPEIPQGAATVTTHSGSEEVYKHDRAEALKAGLEAEKQTEQDQIEADERFVKQWREQQKVSVDAEAGYWASIAGIAEQGSERYKKAEEKLADALDKSREQRARIHALEEQDERNAAEARLKEKELVLSGARELNVRPDKLGAALGVEMPQAQAPSLGANLLTMGGAGSAETQEAKMRANLHRQEYEEALAENKREQQIYADNPEKMRELLNRQHQIEQRYNQQRIQDTVAVSRAMLANITDMVHQMDQALLRGVNQWLTGQKTFAQAMKEAWNGIVASVIEDIEKMALKWVEEHLIMIAISKLLQIVGLDATVGQSAQMAKNNAINMAMASSDAAVAGAATLAYYSVFAPEIAPAMASAQYAIGMGFAGMAALDTGGYIPHDGVAMLHQGEVVVPKQLTSMLTNVAAQGNAFTDASPRGTAAALSPSGGAGDPASISNNQITTSSTAAGDNHLHLSYSPTIHAGSNLSHDDFGKMLDQHADRVVSKVQRGFKQFNR